MKRNEVKLMIIENFINHAFTNETMREALNDVASVYVDEDHVDEFNSLDDVYNFNQIDWAELREQKKTVLIFQEYVGPDSLLSKNLDGLLSLIDSLQDYVVDKLGVDEEMVFGLNDDKPDNVVLNVCSECGSSNVEVKKWVNPNTNKIGEDVIFDDDDVYCNDCEKHVNLKLK